jgi:hypothetical protein
MQHHALPQDRVADAAEACSRQAAPISTPGPTTTLAPITLPGPMLAPAPITAPGPISHPSPITASGAMTALGWTPGTGGGSGWKARQMRMKAR